MEIARNQHDAKMNKNNVYINSGGKIWDEKNNNDDDDNTDVDDGER